MAILMRTDTGRLQVAMVTDVTNDGYGPKMRQVGRRIEWDRFLALELWVQIDDEAINATLILRTDICK